ncbi:glycosyltransferase family 2 protein [Nodularia spumigena]|uniref:Glycosyltransferase n=1 Tax=Nodularia spumigena UHCC 0060 TaxID=3110300 RepID=A0ABU5UWE6_NODSP|nr:glycosyltransferase [Nodularia spumigena]MEA5527945.1 glycosyltransferase [Nodularia spumigena UHCC 0143]MEA5610628.1 glycosyltransferase [Nodularia spumigena UHCC 0060]
MQCDLKHYQESDVAQKVQQLINTHIYEVKDDKLCTEPLVSVWLLTYNHKNFIDEAINSILVQQTNFSYEIVIGDDCSTDGTNEIIRNYQTQYPDKIRLLLAKRNLWQPLPGIQGVTSVALYQTCRGKYIALCEGDDYWTDPLKLQKQVDFLEANPEYSGAFHDIQLLESDGSWGNPRKCIQDFKERVDITLEDTISKTSPFHTSSFIFRSNSLKLPKEFSRYTSGDMAIFMIVASQGKLRRIPNNMSVYRKHKGGITKLTDDHRNIKLYLNRLFMFVSLKSFLYPSSYDVFVSLINDVKARILTLLLSENNISLILRNFSLIYQLTNLKIFLEILFKFVILYPKYLCSFLLFKFKCFLPYSIKRFLKKIFAVNN